MKYAVVRIGGKQFRVEEGDKITVTRQEAPYKLDVLYFSDGSKVSLGTPVLSDVSVKVKLVEDKLGDKVRVARFKSKSRYRKVKGHRQPLSVLEVEKIAVGKAVAASKASEKVSSKSTKESKETKTPAKSAKKTVKKAAKATKSTKPKEAKPKK